MKKSQIIILGILFFANICIISCTKNAPYMNNAHIAGIDSRECPCCGGIEIIIDNVPNPSGNNYFLAGQLPQDFNLGTNPSFPIAIKIDWKKDTARCFGNYISVLRIAKR